MEQPENRRTRLTKTLLKTSLIELMQSGSIQKITIKSICEKADLNRSTFYLHYDDQYALLRDVEQETIDNALAYLQNVDSGISSLAYVQALMDYIRKHKAVFQVLLCHQEAQTFQALFARNITAHLKSRLHFSCKPEVETYIFSFLVQGCASILRDWINNDFDVSGDEIASLIFTLSGSSLAAFLAT